MKTNSFATLPLLLSDLTELPRIAHYHSPQRQKIEVIMLPFSMPPDEKKVAELNSLAAKHPFCIRYRVKKHDML